MSSKGKRFDWSRPVAEAPKTPNVPGIESTNRRLRENKAVRPNKSNLTQEYNAFVNRRRGVK